MSPLYSPHTYVSTTIGRGKDIRVPWTCCLQKNFWKMGINTFAQWEDQAAYDLDIACLDIFYDLDILCLPILSHIQPLGKLWHRCNVCYTWPVSWLFLSFVLNSLWHASMSSFFQVVLHFAIWSGQTVPRPRIKLGIHVEKYTLLSNVSGCLSFFL